MENMILAILQARFSSSRLPGKVLKPILGKPMLLRQIERLQHSQMIEKLVVATSDDNSDDGIVKICLDNNIEVFRGNLNNVLDRFYQCVKTYNPEHVVRLTGDCPLADWQVIDQVIQCHLDSGNDYTSNCLPPTYPDGLDVEVFKSKCLEDAWNRATLPSEKEHVTYYINQRPNDFKIGNFEYTQDLSKLRWTVDEPEDFYFVEKIYKALYRKNCLFTMNDVLSLLKKYPDMSQINDNFNRNEGLVKTLKLDKELLKKNV
jgi:spore coat polysaccharide biosynthesis protein SpsF